MKFNHPLSMTRNAVSARIALCVSILGLGVITSLGHLKNVQAQTISPTPTTSLSASKPSLAMNWNSKGFSSLVYDNREYLLNSSVQVDKATLRSGADTLPFSSTRTTTTDNGSRTITAAYSWGVVTYAYSVVDNELRVAVTVRNTSDSVSIENISFTALNIRLTGDTKISSLNNKNIDDLASNIAETPASVLSLYTTAVDPTMNVSFSAPFGVNKDSYGLKIYATEQRASDFINADSAVIAPLQSKTFSVSLGFYPAGTTQQSVLAPLYQQRVPSVPMQLNWRDRRPIGSIFLANSNTRYTTNPRGWLNDPKINVFTDDGLAAFRKRMLSSADSAVKNLLATGSQGMIFWDLEGEEMPHPTSYIGDPRMLPAMSPEMDSIADEFFARFRNAGLKTGVCLRPSRIRSSETGAKWQHTNMGFDPVEELSQKIDYAQNRWGCRIFYVDSNVTYAYKTGGTLTSWTMRAEMFRSLQARHPDVLLIPEHESYDYWTATAPYGELDMGFVGTPSHVRLSYPEAFSVINIADGSPDQRRAELAEAVKNGDVLLFRCWFNDGTHDAVRSIYADSQRTIEADTDAGTPAVQPGEGSPVSSTTDSSSNSA